LLEAGGLLFGNNKSEYLTGFILLGCSFMFALGKTCPKRSLANQDVEPRAVCTEKRVLLLYILISFLPIGSRLKYRTAEATKIDVRSEHTGAKAEGRIQKSIQ